MASGDVRHDWSGGRGLGTQQDQAMSQFEEQCERWQSQIGEMPDHTCPAINIAQRDLKRAEDYVKSISKKCDTCSDEAKFALYEIGDVYNSLEKLRKENEILRDHAEFWRKKCAELAKDADAFLQENQEELKQLDAYRSLDDNFSCSCSSFCSW